MTKRLTAIALCMLCTGLGATGCGTPAEQSSESGWTTDEGEDPGQEPGEDDAPDVVDPDDGTGPDITPPVLGDAEVGEPCSVDTDCAGGRCLTGPEWPDGYCSTDCEASCDSPGQGCVAGDSNFCAVYCTGDDDCRDGYVCDQALGSPGRVCIAPSGFADGEACNRDNECQGGVCLDDWPGGYCTTPQCEDFGDCSLQGNDNRCLRISRRQSMCVRMCETQADCREGYLCERFGDGSGMCSPDPSQPIDPAVLRDNPFEITCQQNPGPQAVLEFEIQPETTSYMVTPLASDGRGLSPLTISGPQGTVVDMRGAQAFQSVPSQIYAGMNPTMVPAAPQFEGTLQSGTNTYKLNTASDEICYYVLEESQPSNVIDMNIYLVGVPGLDASTAPSHTDLQEALDQFDAIYESTGVTIRNVRYFDVLGDDADRYSVLRSEGAVSALAQLTKRPGDTLDDVLSINIFFVRAFAMGGAIGISLGLPGPAALHGTHGSGVAFTAEYLGSTAQSSLGGENVDGNVFTGQVLAHEVGHYLGLFHTSEQGGYTLEPLEDTPTCGRISLNCPDIDNLMFPFAGASHVHVTPNQSYVVQVNPLTKFDPTLPVLEPSDPEPTDPDATDPNTDPDGGTDPDSGTDPNAGGN